MGIRIITDSTTEISMDEAKKLDITVLPLKTLFGDEVYLDGIDITPEEFYAKLAVSEKLPTTSQPSPFEFEETYKQSLEAGDKIIVICIAANLSGTYQSACMARENFDGDIWVIDSGTATIGLQILVRLAISLRDRGKTAEEIVQIIEDKKDSVCLFAVIDTLEYLYKGGRLSRTSTYAGTLLRVKPLVTLQQGVIKIIGKCLGLKKAYEELLRSVKNIGGIDYSKPFSIGYSGDRGHFSRFEQECRPFFGAHIPLVNVVGSVIGTHAGPGAAAIAFFVAQ